jgi:hypothetical protein
VIAAPQFQGPGRSPNAAWVFQVVLMGLVGVLLGIAELAIRRLWVPGPRRRTRSATGDIATGSPKPPRS